MSVTSMVRPATTAAIVALSALALPEALAQEPTSQSGAIQAVTGAAQRITMTMGKGQLFKTPVPFAKISVTDDKIVDVTPQSNREFVFTPKGVGSTNVLVFDEKNALIATLDINVMGKAVPRIEVRAETYDEIPGRVRIYNTPWRGGAGGGAGGASQGSSLAHPSYYHCNEANCEYAGAVPMAPVGEAASAGPGTAGTPAPSPQGGPPPPDNEKQQ